MKKQSTAAMSLLEVALVLLVLGILIGLAIAGRSMWHNMLLQQTIKDIEATQAAIHGFTQRYSNPPGDLYGMGTARTIRTKRAASNSLNGGDNDGRIETTGQQSGVDLLPTGFDHEIANMFVQLYASGFVKTAYTTPDADDVIIGRHIAGLMGGNVPFFAAYSQDWGGNALFTGSGDGIGAVTDIIELFGDEKGLTPAEAFAIDAKLDDGDPTTGTIRVVSPRLIFKNKPLAYGTSQCIASAGIYNTGLKKGICELVIMLSGGIGIPSPALPR